MQLSKISGNVFQVVLPMVNVFLVDLPSGLLLIDTGPKGSKDLIFKAMSSICKQPEDLKYIILTHAQHDHSGSLADILKSVNAQVFASLLCAKMVRKGIAFELQAIFIKFLLRLMTLFGLIKLQFLNIGPINPLIKTVQEGDWILDENSLQIINAPGHAAEQIALFYPVKEALLFAADAAENIKSLKPAFAYQSAKINQQTLQKLSYLPFDTALFGYGNAVDREMFNKLVRYEDYC